MVPEWKVSVRSIPAASRRKFARYFHGAIAPSRRGAIPRPVFGGGLRRRRGHDNGVAKVRTQRRRGEAALTVHPCTRFQRVVYQPTVPAYCLSAYLLTYLHTYTHILRSCGEPRPASIARVCITRTYLSIGPLPRLASSPRLLPFSRGVKRRETKRGKKKSSPTPTFRHLDRNEEHEIPSPSCHVCASVALCLHWYRNDTEEEEEGGGRRGGLLFRAGRKPHRDI